VGSARPSYRLTRFLILRLIGFVYFFAFLSLARQVLPLIGERGLLPASTWLERVALHFGTTRAAFLQMPSLFWWHCSDGMLAGLAWLGVGLSFLVLVGFANAPLLVILWALYFSFVSIGQDWYGYGWEIQLLETGMLAVFLAPPLDPRPFPKRAPPEIVIWLFRWLAFRIMLGAGLIKIRGDQCWRDLTCLASHYETQPIPNPVSRFYHFMPMWFHKGGALYNHLVELVSPWFLFTPRVMRHVAGALMVAFQLILISSGNLSFLNYLTLVPVLAAFDDDLLSRVLPRVLVARAERSAAAPEAETSWGVPASAAHRWAAGAYAVVVAILSVNPALNLMSSGQMMNTSFDRLHLVNTYGAFGSVGKERHEIVFEGTADETVTDQSVWKEYDFWCKPGDPMRRPCVIAPFQPRLDWQIWFAAMSSPEHYPWTLHFVWKLLHNDPGLLGLLATNPFPAAPPRHVRAVYYTYAFAPPGNPDHAWWTRTRLGLWLPDLSVDDPRLLRFMEAYGWRTD
jgi:hypothetical protein